MMILYKVTVNSIVDKIDVLVVAKSFNDASKKALKKMDDLKYTTFNKVSFIEIITDEKGDNKRILVL